MAKAILFWKRWFRMIIRVLCLRGRWNATVQNISDHLQAERRSAIRSNCSINCFIWEIVKNVFRGISEKKDLACIIRWDNVRHPAREMWIKKNTAEILKKHWLFWMDRQKAFYKIWKRKWWRLPPRWILKRRPLTGIWSIVWNRWPSGRRLRVRTPKTVISLQCRGFRTRRSYRYSLSAAENWSDGNIIISRECRKKRTTMCLVLLSSRCMPERRTYRGNCGRKKHRKTVRRSWNGCQKNVDTKFFSDIRNVVRKSGFWILPNEMRKWFFCRTRRS